MDLRCLGLSGWIGEIIVMIKRMQTGGFGTNQLPSSIEHGSTRPFSNMWYFRGKFLCYYTLVFLLGTSCSRGGLYCFLLNLIDGTTSRYAR